jgi:hypothetical protein
MMLRQDGSRNEWLVGWPALVLIVTVDDATSAILLARPRRFVVGKVRFVFFCET